MQGLDFPSTRADFFLLLLQSYTYQVKVIRTILFRSSAAVTAIRLIINY